MDQSSNRRILVFRAVGLLNTLCRQFPSLKGLQQVLGDICQELVLVCMCFTTHGLHGSGVSAERLTYNLDILLNYSVLILFYSFSVFFHYFLFYSY